MVRLTHRSIMVEFCPMNDQINRLSLGHNKFSYRCTALFRQLPQNKRVVAQFVLVIYWKKILKQRREQKLHLIQIVQFIK